MEAKLIAPCGINCGVCMAYLRTNNHCPGCRDLKSDLPVSISRCAVRSCETIRLNSSGLCYECEAFPCRRVKQLDKRYTTKYHMSMIGNLRTIRDKGMATFLDREANKWRCPDCGGTVSCHRLTCAACGAILSAPPGENQAAT